MSKYAVCNPATGEVVETFPSATDEEVAAAVASAHDAYTGWGRTSTVAERAALVRRVAELHRERAGELAKAINEEMGKALAAAEGEVLFSADIYQYYADRAEEFLADQEIELLGGEGRALLRRQPVGALLGIMPWNYPVYQVARFAAPNLVTGNTIVLKHAAQCPRSAALQAAIFRDAGLPEGAYVNVYATNDQIADVIADPRIQGVSLTGSERAGSIIGEIAGRNLKKCVLELGGADPFVLLSTDDLDGAVDDALSARTGNVGQPATAPSGSSSSTTCTTTSSPRCTSGSPPRWPERRCPRSRRPRGWPSRSTRRSPPAPTWSPPASATVPSTPSAC